MNKRKGKSLRVYVAGPISADTHTKIALNVFQACWIAKGIILKGHFPFIPHLLWFLGLERSWEWWMEFDDIWLRQCEALFYIGPSRGADIELARAKERGLKIFYSLDEL